MSPKMESIFRGVPPASSLTLRSDFVRSIIQPFLWMIKIHYIKKAIPLCQLSEGWLETIDFECMHGTFKLNCLEQLC